MFSFLPLLSSIALLFSHHPSHLPLLLTFSVVVVFLSPPCPVYFSLDTSFRFSASFLPIHTLPPFLFLPLLPPSDRFHYHVSHGSPALLLMDDLTRILIYCSINNITSYSPLTSPPPLPMPSPSHSTGCTLQTPFSDFSHFLFATLLPLCYTLLISSSLSLHFYLKLAHLV